MTRHLPPMYRCGVFVSIVAFCFSAGIFNVEGTDKVPTVSLKPVETSTVAGIDATVSPLSLQHVSPAGSISADATAASLPQLLTSPEAGGEDSFFSIGQILWRQFVARGNNLLTPRGLAATLEQGGNNMLGESVAGVGMAATQSAIDHGLSRVERHLLGDWVRGINFSYTPAFAERKSLLQADMLLSLRDGSNDTFLGQFGLQSRDGEAAANIGLIWRHKVSEDLLLGANSFYDYLSDPRVDRWSFGVEATYHALTLSTNYYKGLGEERKADIEYYSPDGWDVELSGYLEKLPWLEYSGRYYRWDVDSGRKLKGSDYGITVRPVPLFGIVFRYDNPDAGGADFGVEGTLEYRFDVPLAGQLKFDKARGAGSVWQHRFSRVRREYEQRVRQRIVGAVMRRMTVGRATTSCMDSGTCNVNIPVMGDTSNVDQVVVRVDGTPTPPSVGNGVQRGGGLLRESGNCVVIGVEGAMCSFDRVSGTIEITGIPSGTYNFSVNFVDDSGTMLSSDSTGSVSVLLEASVHTGIASTQAGSIAELGGAIDITVSINGVAAPGGLRVALTASGTATPIVDYTQRGLTGTGTDYTALIEEGASSVTFVVAAVPDAMDDDNETVVFTLSAGVGYSVAPSPANEVTVTIVASSGATPLLANLYIGTAGNGTGMIDEDGGTSVTVTVELDRAAPAGGITVSLVRSGSASDSDYSTSGLVNSGSGYTLTVVGSVSVAQFILTAVDDSVDDDDESVVFSLQSGSGYIAGETASSTIEVTIVDNDDPPPVAGISVDSATMAEAAPGNTAIVTVSLNGAAPTGGITVNLSRSGSATMGGGNDYTVSGITSGNDPDYTVTVVAAATSAMFTLTAVDDTVSDIAETIVFTLQDGSGYILDAGVDNEVVVSIVDNDIPGISSSNPRSLLLIEGRSASYNLVLNTIPTANVAIELVADSSLVSLQQSMLTFTISNWNMPQAVTVSSSAGSITADTFVGINYTITSIDTGYNGLDADTQQVTLENVTVPQVTDLNAAPGPDRIVLSWTNPVYNDLAYVRISAVNSLGTVIDLDLNTGNSHARIPAISGSTGTTTVDGLSNVVAYAFSVYTEDAAGNMSAAATIRGTPSLPQISMLSAAATVREGEMASIRISLSGNLAQDLSVSCAVSSTASGGGVDYSIASGEITISPSSPYVVVPVFIARISAGQLQGSLPGFTLSAVADMLTEGGSEQVVFTLMPGDGYSIGSQAVHTVTIADTSRTTASVYTGSPGAQTASITEAGSDSTTVTVMLSSPAPAGGLVVNLARTGNATPGDDFTVSGATSTNQSYTVTVAAGMNTASITLAAVDDSVDDDDETIMLAVLPGQGYDAAAGSARSVEVSIVDDDLPPPVASIAADRTTITETAAGNSATVTLTLSRVAPANLTLNLIRSGSSTIGSDYTVATLQGNNPNYSIEVAATVTTATFTLTAVDDSTVDADETIVFTLQDGNGYTVAPSPVNMVTVTIVDNDAAGVTSSQSSVIDISEGGSSTYTLVLNAMPAANVEIDIASNVASVMANPRQLVFTSGNWSTPRTVTVSSAASSITTDTTATLSYTVTSTGNDYDEFTIIPQQVMVRNVTVSPVVALTATATIAPRVTLSWINPADTAGARISATTGGVAVDLNGSGDGNDLVVTTLTSQLAISTGISTGASYIFSVVARNIDGNESTAETVNVTVGPVLNFAMAAAAVDEGSSIAVRLVYGGTITSPLTVNYAISGTADRTTDYTESAGTITAISATQFTIQANTDGSPISANAPVFTFAALADMVAEGEESVTLTIMPGSGYIVGGTFPSHTITIADTSRTTASIYNNNPGNQAATITEAAGTTRSTTITVALGSPAQAEGVTVNIVVAPNSTASHSNDYTISNASGTHPDYTITIQPGDTTANLTITAVDDTVTDPAETIVLTLQANSGYTVAAGTVTVTITDDDIPTAGISIQAETITEAAGTTRSTIATVTLGNTAPPGGITVNITRTTATTATLGSDFTVAMGISGTDPNYTITIQPGNTTANFTLTAIDDTVTDPAETIVFQVQTGTGYTPDIDTDTVTVTITDNDQDPSVTVTPSSISTAEGTGTGNGTSITLTFTLRNLPAGDVTVNISSTTGTADRTTDYTLSQTTVTLNTSSTQGTITVNTVPDAIAEQNETIILQYQLTGTGAADIANTPTDTTLTITDDDTGGITSTGGASVAVTEGSEASYTLVLTSQPADTVTIELTSSDTSAVTVNSPISFSTTDWNTAKTVTLTGEEDGDIAGESVTISYGISGGDYDSVTLEAQRVAVTDNDTGGITSTGGASVAVTEGSEATYELVLTVAPTGPVTITLTSDDTGAVTVTPMITFDASDWNTMKTVTVTAEDDADATDESVTITYGISGGGYDAVTLTAQSVTVDDDETATPAGVTSSQSGALALTEGGSDGTYTLVLDTEPTDTVTIDLTSDDTGAVTVTPQLMFTTSTWNTAQTVTVTVVDDPDATDETVSITYVVTSTDTDYDGFSITAQSVTVDDDETATPAGVTSSQSGALALMEGGSAGTYTLVLDTEPTDTVTIDLTSDDTGAVTVTPQLMFTTSTWNTAQTVTVTVVDDPDATDETVSITYVVTSTDTDYDGFSITAQSVTVDDDETATPAGVTSSQSGALALMEGGSAGTYTLVLDTEPTDTVTIDLTSDNTGAVTVTPQLMFTTSTWNTAQTVTVTVVDDADATDEDVTITYGISGGGYDSVTLTAQSVTVDDDETATTAGVTSSQSGALALTEGGSAGTYTLVLDTEPTGTVTITLTSSDTGAVTVTPTLSFDATDWSSTKTVTVTVVDDADATDESVTITYGISGGGYGAVTLTAQSVTVDDDETAGVTSSQSGALALTEGGSAGTYTLVLATEPTGTVTITLTSSDTGAVTVTPTLSFDATDWSSTKTVTVTVVDDADATDEDVTITYGISGGGYDSVTLTAQSVTVDDDETAGVTSSQSGALALTEGGSAGTYTLVLDTEPTGTVTIDLTSDDTGAVTVTPQLMFTTSTWNTAQTVTVTVVDDPDATDETVSITYVVTSTDTDYDGFSITAQSVTVDDDETATPAGITSSQSGALALTEGGSAGTYTLVLDTQPTGTVTITLTSSDTGAVTVNSPISFDATDWSNPKTVTVTVVDDADATDERVTITYGISGGGYDSVTLTAQSVTVDDDETAGVTSSQSGALALTEGGSAGTYTLVLATEPTGTVTIVLTSSDTGAVTVTPTLSFDATDWSSTKTVTVTVVDDADATDEDVTITYGISGGGYDGVTLTAQSVTVTDDDLAGAAVTSTGVTSLSVTEGATVTYTLVLAIEPTGTVTITLTSDDTTSVTVTPMISFNASDWNVAQTVTVTAVDDADMVSETVSISYAISGGGYDLATLTDQSVTVTDNDSAEVTVSADSMTMPETGGTVTVTFTLSNPATGNVIIDIDTAGSATRDTDYRLSATRLTLDNSNPPTSLTGSITVTATPDSVSDNNETIMLSYSLSGSGASGITAPPATNLTITEGPSVTVRTSGNSMTEEGSTNSVTLDFTLNSFVGSGNVTVTVGAPTGSAMLTDDYTLSAMSVMLTMDSPTDSITITAVADDIDEGSAEDIMLSYSVNPTSVDAPGSTTLTITDNDTRGINPGTAPALTIGEGGSEDYTLVLTSEPMFTVTIALSLAGSDIGALGFTAPPTITATTSLEFTTGNWDTAQTVTVYADEDDDSVDETATISFIITGGDYGNSAVTLGDQAVNVTDNDDATVTAVANAMVMSETSGTVTITFTLAHPPAGDVIVTVNTPTGSATLNTDYRLSPTQVTLNAGNLEDTITVTATPDSVSDNNETIMLSYSVSGGITAPPATTLTIIEAPTVMVAVSPAGGSVAEGTGSGNGGVITLTFSLSSAPLVLTNNVIVDVNTTTGTAVLADYSLSSMSVTLDNNNNFTDTITVSVEPDTIVEPDETIELSYDVSRSTANVTGPDSGTNLTITNDDSSMMTVEVEVTPGTPVTTLEEGDTGTVTLRLSAPVYTDVTVMVATNNDGTAKAVEPAPGIMADFTAISSQAVTITAGTTSATVTGGLVILDDTVAEAGASETLNITITGPDPAIPGLTVTASTAITILDTDTTELGIAANQTVTEETTDEDNITITLSLPRSEDLEVTVNTGAVGSGMDATAGTDYTALTNHTVTIPAYSTSHEFAVDILNDAVVEGDEVFRLQISSDRVALGIDDTAIVTITDNDNGQLRLAPGSRDVPEDDPDGMVSFELQIVDAVTPGPDNNPNLLTLDTDLTVTLSAVGSGVNPATAGAIGMTPSGANDFSLALSPLPPGPPPVNIMVTITETDRSPSFTLNLNNDDTAEGTEGIELTITATATNLEVSTPVTLNIIDDDFATLRVMDAPLTFAENAGTETVTVQLTQALSSNLEVDIATADGTAIAGAAGSGDYASYSQRETFTAGELTKTFDLVIQEDMIIEGNETLTITLTVVTAPVPAGLTVDSPAMVTITDNDSATLTLSPTTVGENYSRVPLTFALSPDGVVLSDNLVIELTIDSVNSSATAGEDYTLSATTLTIMAGVRNTTVNLTLGDDDIREGDETFILTLAVTSPDPVPVGLAVAPSVEVMILDNEYIALYVSDTSVMENTGTVDIPIAITGGILLDDLVLTVSTADGIGTAMAGDNADTHDYVGLSGLSVTIPAGETWVYPAPSITIHNNDVVEPDMETFIVTVSVSSQLPEGVTIDPVTVTVTIDDTADTSILSVSPTSINEPAADGASATSNMMLSLDNLVASAFTVDVTTDDVFSFMDATAGTDYTAITTAVTINFAALARTGNNTASLVLAGDNVAEGNEVLNIVLNNLSITDTNISSSRITVTTPTAITIVDDDMAGLSIGDVASVNEGESAALPLTLDRILNTDLEITVTVNPGTATADDYTAPATVTIDAGQDSATVTIPITDDTLVEGEEAFTVTISVASPPPSFSITDNSADVTIAASDRGLLRLAPGSRSVPEDDSADGTADGMVQLELQIVDAATPDIPDPTPGAPPGRTVPNFLTVTNSLEVTLAAVGGSTNPAMAATVGATPTGDEDFSLASGTVTIEAGISSEVFTLFLNNDDTLEGDEEISLTMILILEFSVTNTVSASPVTITITDND